ncbi:MAG: hypothetical protein ACTHW2_03690 [Tissierella sp.]|uniref:hypothetical protein n=1 Tax=Tissierella sp. TaxID=41274 RepID=UPI003F97A625
MLVAKSELNDYEAQPLYDEKEEERKIIKKNRAIRRRRKQKMLFKLSCIFFATMLTITSLFILRGYSNISEIRMNITNLERRKNELEQTKNSMVSELEEAKSSIKISEEAMYKLSMDYPSKDQVVYLSLDGSKETVKDN